MIKKIKIPNIESCCFTARRKFVSQCNIVGKLFLKVISTRNHWHDVLFISLCSSILWSQGSIHILTSISTWKKLEYIPWLDNMMFLMISRGLQDMYLVFDSSIPINTLAWFWCKTVLMRVCYPQRSYSPYFNFVPDLINGAY